MERIIFMVIRRLFIAPIWYYKIKKASKNEKLSEEEKYEVLHKIVVKINKIANVNIKVEGLNNIPEKNGYILFPNHQGLFDALLLLGTQNKPFTFVLKKEIENTFLIKDIIKLLKAQVIDRNDLRQSLMVINNMTNEVKEGRNYVIFPEGTRSKNGNNLLDFKGGSFKSAVNAKCPIIPVAIINSYKVLDNKSIRKVDVYITYLKPIKYEEYCNLNTKEIAELSKKSIEKYILEKINKK